MAQVSLPMRIALLVTLSFAGVWLVALRPKPEAIAPLPDPVPVTRTAPKTATKAETKAADTKAAAKPRANVTKTEAGVSAPKGSARARAVEAVLADLDARKVVVLLFWMQNGSDDQEVRRAVGDVNRLGGRVAVHTAPVSHLADYEPITAGVPVVGTPTTLIIDRNRKARIIAGLTVTSEIDQRVEKALKASR